MTLAAKLLAVAGQVAVDLHVIHVSASMTLLGLVMCSSHVSSVGHGDILLASTSGCQVVEETTPSRFYA